MVQVSPTIQDFARFHVVFKYERGHGIRGDGTRRRELTGPVLGENPNGLLPRFYQALSELSEIYSIPPSKDAATRVHLFRLIGALWI